jgi:hypothetical protein
LKNVKPGALEERAALLKEWAEFLLAQQASKQPDKAKNGGSVTSSPAASPLPSPKKGRMDTFPPPISQSARRGMSAHASLVLQAGFGTLRRRKKDEEKDPATEDLDEDVAGTIINNEELLLRYHTHVLYSYSSFFRTHSRERAQAAVRRDDQAGLQGD